MRESYQKQYYEILERLINNPNKKRPSRIGNIHGNFVEVIRVNLLKEFPVFTTIFKKGDLRGCIGYTITDAPLADNIRETAVLASSRDPRFKPVAIEELDILEVELSVLSRFQRVYDNNKIEIGKDGLYFQLGQYSGLFLPEVPVEQGWHLREYLENLSQKAGLSKDGYRDPKTRIYKYYTQKIK